MIEPTINIISPLEAAQLCRELTAGLPDWFGIPEANQRYAKGCGEHERTTFAAKMGNDFIGMITLEFPFSNNANIYWMGVRKEHQHKNVGKQLIKTAAQYCLEKGFKSITVETLSLKEKDPYYLNTYHFYLKCGFKPLFELPPYGPELLMCYMQKQIA